MNKHIEKAFRATTNVLFGKELTDFGDYGKWLVKDNVKVKKLKSLFSGKTIYYFDANSYNRDSCKSWRETISGMEDVLVTIEESYENAKTKIPLEELDELTVKNSMEMIKDIKYISIDHNVEPSVGIEEVFCYMQSTHCIKGCYYFHSKYCAYSNFPSHSEHMFGTNIVSNSKMCIRCYDSSKLIRCFEVGESNNCRDSYFCYNCENLDNCMFCFNATSKRYAIGNIEIGKEKYMEIKKRVIEDIWHKLNKNKKLEWNIYNIGCHK